MRNETKCCATCKHCIFDFSVSDGATECGNENHGNWVHRENEAYWTPQWDYCTTWEHDPKDDERFWKVACKILSKRL